MARGVGERPVQDQTQITFWDLPEDVQARIEAWGCRDGKVQNFFDLSPDKRRAAREGGVQRYLKESR